MRRTSRRLYLSWERSMPNAEYANLKIEKYLYFIFYNIK
jgi:hypothetical protein